MQEDKINVLEFNQFMTEALALNKGQKEVDEALLDMFSLDFLPLDEKLKSSLASIASHSSICTLYIVLNAIKAGLQPLFSNSEECSKEVFMVTIAGLHSRYLNFASTALETILAEDTDTKEEVTPNEELSKAITDTIKLEISKEDYTQGVSDVKAMMGKGEKTDKATPKTDGISPTTIH